MPELPEVEVTRRSFATAIAGARIEAVMMGKPLRWPLGCDPQVLGGQQVVGLRRRGKYLLLDMNQGVLLLHLGMSGSLRFASDMPEAGGMTTLTLSPTGARCACMTRDDLARWSMRHQRTRR